MASKVTEYQVEGALNKLTTEAERKKLSRDTLHFVPINIEALNLALSDKLVFTENDADDLDAVLAEINEKYKFASKKDRDKAIATAKKNFGVRGEGLIDIADLRNRLCNFIVSKHEYKIVQKGGQFYSQAGQLLQGSDLVAAVPAVVYENSVAPTNIIGALYKSYDTTRQNLFQNFLNTEIKKFLNKDIYQGSNFSEGFDVGHILGNSKLATTPLAEKLKRVIEYIDSVLEYSSLAEQTKLQELKKGTQQTLSILRAQSGYGPKIEATLSQDTRSALLSAEALIVVIQERRENQETYGRLIEGDLGRQILELIAKLGFSKSIVETIEVRVHEALKHGKVKNKGKLGKKVIKTQQSKRTPATVTSSTSGKRTKIPSKTLPKPTGIIPSSITELRQLLDASLVQQVKQNMGSGNRRDVLNLRSGRFAESVEATNISQSKQGAITVFYRYMKNPYATFSQGGRQQYPRSRDPKLLISRSIRELAAQQMITKLRTVVQ